MNRGRVIRLAIAVPEVTNRPDPAQREDDAGHGARVGRLLGCAARVLIHGNGQWADAASHFVRQQAAVARIRTTVALVGMGQLMGQRPVGPSIQQRQAFSQVYAARVNARAIGCAAIKPEVLSRLQAQPDPVRRDVLLLTLVSDCAGCEGAPQLGWRVDVVIDSDVDAPGSLTAAWLMGTSLSRACIEDLVLRAKLFHCEVLEGRMLGHRAGCTGFTNTEAAWEDSILLAILSLFSEHRLDNDQIKQMQIITASKGMPVLSDKLKGLIDQLGGSSFMESSFRHFGDFA